MFAHSPPRIGRNTKWEISGQTPDRHRYGRLTALCWRGMPDMTAPSWPPLAKYALYYVAIAVGWLGCLDSNSSTILLFNRPLDSEPDGSSCLLPLRKLGPCRFVNGMACLPHAKGLARAYNYIDWQCCARLSALPWSIGGHWGGHDWANVRLHVPCAPCPSAPCPVRPDTMSHAPDTMSHVSDTMYQSHRVTFILLLYGYSVFFS